jgi:Tol biopolymer transport system component
LIVFSVPLLSVALTACGAQPPLGGDPTPMTTGEQPAAGAQPPTPAAPQPTPAETPQPTQPMGVPGACGAQLPADIRARFIAFDSDREDFRRQLYLMHADGSSVTRLLTDSSADREPAFSPDGKKVAFTSDRAGGPQIFLLDLATRAVTKLTSRPEGADQPSFSHDGARVTFHSGASVYVVGADASGERLVATGPDTFNAFFWPHFSVDGTELVFDRNNEIDAVATDSSSKRMIVQNTTTMIKAPAVSPDGNDVAYQAQCFEASGRMSIWTTPFSTNTDVCKGRRVTPVDDAFASARPAWGSIGLLAYERVDPGSNVASIAVISRALGSSPCVIATGGGDYRNPSWSP